MALEMGKLESDVAELKELVINLTDERQLPVPEYRHKLHVYGPSNRGAVRRHAILSNHIAKLLNLHQMYRTMRILVTDVGCCTKCNMASCAASTDAATGFSATRLEFEYDIITLARFFCACFVADAQAHKDGFSSRQPAVQSHLYHNPARKTVFEGTMEEFADKARAYHKRAGVIGL